MRKQSSFIRIYDAEQDPELESIDQFIDDEVINHTFSYKHQSRFGRKPIPFSVKLRIHIVKSIKRIPSFNMTVKETRQRRAYRKFCKISNKFRVPCAASLTNFRKELTFQDKITLMSIFIRKAEELAFFDTCFNLHVIDSTDLESPCSSKVIKKDRVEHYHDPTATKGKRASKKGKSKYFIGNRKHTLSVVARNNKTIPLLSLVAPANQHDGGFLLPLLHIAKTIGLEVNYVVGDLGYIDTGHKRVAKERYGVAVYTDKKRNTKLPYGVDDTGAPECMLGIQMRWISYDGFIHSYGCGLGNANRCVGCEIKRLSSEDYPVAFGEIPVHTKVGRELVRKRKLIEPQFWRDKELYGLGKVVLMKVENVHFLSVIADICEILKSLSKFSGTTKICNVPSGSFSSGQVKLAPRGRLLYKIRAGSLF